LTEDSREARDIEISLRFPWDGIVEGGDWGLLSGFES
jgi:hypothetical protein